MGKRLLTMVLGLVVAVVLVGCGGGTQSGSENAEKTLTLGDIGWTEDVAVDNLTKVVLEEDLGYKEVELKTLDVGLLFQGVAGGDLNAFLDVWLPNHTQLLAKVKNDVKHLPPWYQGQTTFGLAVPYYMSDTKSIADLNESGAEEIIGIEPGAVISERVPKYVIPEYHLNLEYKPSSTAAMLSEVGRLYKEKEPFVFPPWCPNPMCGKVTGAQGTREFPGKFDFRYLEDPKNSQGNLDQPAKISAIVNEDLPDDDPVAYAFINNIRLNDAQLVALENEIAKADSPVAGTKAWLEDNRDVVQPAIDAAKKAQES